MVTIHPLRKGIIISLFLLLIAQGIQAKEEEREKDKEQKAYSSSTSFSLLMTSGNTQEFTLGFDTEQNLKFKKDQIQFKGSVIYSESEGSKDTEVYNGDIEYKRTFSSKAYLLASGRFERNVQSGYNYRFAFSAGGGYIWMKSKKIEFSTEAALGWSRENNIKKITDETTLLSFASCLASSRLKIKLSDTSELVCQELFFLNLKNTNDYRLSSLASLAVNISSHLALKISYQLKTNHRPVPGFKNTDQYFISSLVFNY
jgi:putative salt-induced outer membrane protein YdiY